MTAVTPTSARADADEDLEHVLLFDVGDQSYALPVEQVTRVVPTATPSPLPGAPPEVLGLLTIRGAVVPVMDPKAVLDIEPRPLTRRARVLVTAAGAGPMGILVDAVRDVAEVPRAALVLDLDDHPDDGAARGVAGTVTIDDRTIPLLDVGTLAPH